MFGLFHYFLHLQGLLPHFGHLPHLHAPQPHFGQHFPPQAIIISLLKGLNFKYF